MHMHVWCVIWEPGHSDAGWGGPWMLADGAAATTRSHRLVWTLWSRGAGGWNGRWCALSRRLSEQMIMIGPPLPDS